MLIMMITVIIIMIMQAEPYMRIQLLFECHVTPQP